MRYKTIILCLFGIIVFGLACYFIFYREQKIEEFQSPVYISSDYIVPTISPDTNFTVKSFSTLYGVQSEQLAYMSSLTTYRGGQLSNFMGYLSQYGGYQNITNNIEIYNVCGHNGGADYPGFGDQNFGFYFTYIPGDSFPQDYYDWRGHAASLIDIRKRQFLKTSLWNTISLNTYISNYAGLPELNGYKSDLHQEFDGGNSCQLSDNTGIITSVSPRLNKTTEITSGGSELQQINIYGSYTNNQSNDFSLCIHWGSALNFSNTNYIDMYINVPYFNNTFSGFTSFYSYGLFYPELRSESATQMYNYVADLSGSLWNNQIKALNQGTTIQIPTTFDPGITYDSNGIGKWPNPIPSFHIASTYPVPPNDTINSLEQQFIGYITAKNLALMPQTQRRYIISFVYNRTQSIMNTFMNNLATNTNSGSNIAAYNSIVPSLFFYNLYIDESFLTGKNNGSGGTYTSYDTTTQKFTLVQSLDDYGNCGVANGRDPSDTYSIYNNCSVISNANSNTVYTNNFLPAYPTTSATYTNLLSKYGSATNVENAVNNAWQRISYGTIIELAFLYSCAYANQYYDSNGIYYTTPQSNGNPFYDYLSMYPVPSNCDGIISYKSSSWVSINDSDGMHESVTLFTFSNIPQSVVNIQFIKYMACLLPSVRTVSVQGPDAILNYTLYFSAGSNPALNIGSSDTSSRNYNTTPATIVTIPPPSITPTSVVAGVYYFTRSGNLPRPYNQDDLSSMLANYDSAIFKLPVDYGASKTLNIQNKPMLNMIAQYIYDKSQGLYEVTMIYDVFQIGSNMLDIRYDKLQRLDSNIVRSLEVEYAPQVKQYNTLLNMYFDNTWAVIYSNNISNYTNDLEMAQSNISMILTPTYPLSNLNPNDLSNTINYLTYLNSNLELLSEKVQGNAAATGINPLSGIAAATIANTGIDPATLSNLSNSGSVSQGYSAANITYITFIQNQIATNTDLINTLSNELSGILTNVARVFYTGTGNDTNGDLIIQINGMAFGPNAALSYNPAYNASLQMDIGNSSGNVNYSPVTQYKDNVIQSINCADVDFMREAAQQYMNGIFNNLSSFTSNTYQQSNGDVRVDGIRGFSNLGPNKCGFTWDEVQYDYFTNIANVNRTVNVVIPFKYDNSIFQNPLLMIDNTIANGFSITPTSIGNADNYPWYQTTGSSLDPELRIQNNNETTYSPYITYLANVQTYGDNLRFILANQILYAPSLRNYLLGISPTFMNGTTDHSSDVNNYNTNVSYFYPNESYNYLLSLYGDSNIGSNFQILSAFSNNTINSLQFNVYGTTYTYTTLIPFLQNTYNSNNTAAILPQLQSNYLLIQNFLGTGKNYNNLILDPTFSIANFISFSNTITQIPLYNYISFTIKFYANLITYPGNDQTRVDFTRHPNVDFFMSNDPDTGLIYYPTNLSFRNLTMLKIFDNNSNIISYCKYGDNVDTTNNYFTFLQDPINSNLVNSDTIDTIISIYNQTSNSILTYRTFYVGNLNYLVTTINNLILIDKRTTTQNVIQFNGFIDSGSKEFINNLTTLDPSFLGELNILLDPFTYQYNLLANSGFIIGYSNSVSNIRNLTALNNQGCNTSFYCQAEEDAYGANDIATLAIYKTWRQNQYIPILREPLEETTLTNTYGACGDTQYPCSDPLVMGQIMDYYNFDSNNPNGDKILRILKAFTPNQYQCDIKAEFIDPASNVYQDQKTFIIGQDIDSCKYYIASYENSEGHLRNTGYFISDSTPYVISNDTHLAGFQYVNYTLGGFSNTLSNIFTGLYSNAVTLNSNMWNAYSYSRRLTYDSLGKIQTITFPNPGCRSLIFDYNTLSDRIQNNPRFLHTFFASYPYTDSHMVDIIRVGIKDPVNRYVEVVYTKQLYAHPDNLQTAGAIYQINITSDELCDYSASWVSDSLPATNLQISNVGTPLNYTQLLAPTVELFQLQQPNQYLLDDFLPIPNPRTYLDPSIRASINVNSKKLWYDVLLQYANNLSYNGYLPKTLNVTIYNVTDNVVQCQLYGSLYNGATYQYINSGYILTFTKKIRTYEEYSVSFSSLTTSLTPIQSLTFQFDAINWYPITLMPPLTLTNLSYITGVSQIKVAHQITNAFGAHVDLYCSINSPDEILSFNEQYFSFDLYKESDDNIYVLEQDTLVNENTSYYRYIPDPANINNLMTIFQTYYNSIFKTPNYPYNSHIVNFYSYTTPDIGDQTITFGVSIYYYDSTNHMLYHDPTNSISIVSLPPNVDYLNNIKYFKVKFWQLPQSTDSTYGTPSSPNTNDVFIWKYTEVSAPSITNVYPYNPISIATQVDLTNSLSYTINTSIINIPNKDSVFNNIYYNSIQFTGNSNLTYDYQLAQIQLYRDSNSKNSLISLDQTMSFLTSSTNLQTRGNALVVDNTHGTVIILPLNTPTQLNGYSFVSGDDTSKYIRQWTLQGSFDGINWFLISDYTSLDYTIVNFYPSKFYQLPLFSFLSSQVSITLPQNPIHPKSFGECPIHFTDQFLAKAIGSNFSSYDSGTIDVNDYSTQIYMKQFIYDLKSLDYGYNVDYTNTISFYGRTNYTLWYVDGTTDYDTYVNCDRVYKINNIQLKDQPYYVSPTQNDNYLIEYVVTIDDIYDCANPVISNVVQIDHNGVVPSDYTNIKSSHIGEIISAYCSSSPIQVNNNVFMNRIVNDIYAHRFDATQTNNLSNNLYTNILAADTIIFYDTMDVSYIMSNVTENTISYIINIITSNAGATSNSNVNVAYTLVHNFISDCSNFTIKTLDYDSVTTNHLHNDVGTPISILNSINPNYTQITLSPSFNQYVLSNKAYVRNNCFPIFNDIYFLQQFSSDNDTTIISSLPSATTYGGMDKNLSITYYKIDYDNFIFTLIIKPQYRKLYFANQYQIENPDNTTSYINDTHAVGNPIYYYNDYSPRDIAFLHIDTQSPNPRWYDTNKSFVVSFSLSDAANNIICTCGSITSSFYQNLTYINMDYLSNTSINTIGYLSNQNSLNYPEYFSYTNIYTSYYKTSDLLVSNGLNYTTFLTTITTLSDQTLVSYLSNQGFYSNDMKGILYYKVTTNNLLYSYIVNIISYGPNSNYNGDIDFENQYLEIVYNPYHVKPTDRNDYLFFVDPTTVNTWDITIQSISRITTNLSNYASVNGYTKYYSGDLPIVTYESDMITNFNSCSFTPTTDQFITHIKSLITYQNLTNIPTFSNLSAVQYTSILYTKDDLSNLNYRYIITVYDSLQNVYENSKPSDYTVEWLLHMGPFIDCDHIGFDDSFNGLISNFTGYTPYVNDVPSLLSDNGITYTSLITNSGGGGSGPIGSGGGPSYNIPDITSYLPSDFLPLNLEPRFYKEIDTPTRVLFSYLFAVDGTTTAGDYTIYYIRYDIACYSQYPTDRDSYLFPTLISNSNVQTMINLSNYIPYSVSGSQIGFDLQTYCSITPFTATNPKFISVLTSALNNNVEISQYTKVIGYYNNNSLLGGSFDYIIGLFSGNTYYQSYVYSIGIDTSKVISCSDINQNIQVIVINNNYTINTYYSYFDPIIIGELLTVTPTNFNTSSNVLTANYNSLSAYGRSGFTNYIKSSYDYISFESKNKFFVNQIQLFDENHKFIKTKLIKKDMNIIILETLEEKELFGYSFITNSKDSTYNPTSWTIKGMNDSRWKVLDKRQFNTPSIQLHQVPMFLLNGHMKILDQPKSYDKPIHNINTRIDKTIFEKYYTQKINSSYKANCKKYIYDSDNDIYYIIFDEYDLNDNLIKEDLIIGYAMASNKIKKAIMYEDHNGNYKAFDMKNKKMKMFWDLNIAIPLVFEEF